ncbi:MAG: hypothetical protein KDD45_09960, partial [Bdellovibrionales bacterium]|nr:hypothetical protein [Bdellovibrionales bacterium]
EFIYFATKNACINVTPEKALNSNLESDNYRAGIFPSNDFNKLLMEVTHESMRGAISEFKYIDENYLVDQITKNQGFIKAINECYNKNEIMKAFFIAAIKRADIRGKVLAGVSTAVLFKGMNTFLGKLGTWGAKIFNGIQFSTMAFATILIYQDLYNHKKIQDYLKESCGDPKDSTYSDCVAQLYNSSLERLENNLETQNDLNKNIENTLIKMAKEQIIFLENELKNEPSDRIRNQIIDQINDRKQFIIDFSKS